MHQAALREQFLTDFKFHEVANDALVKVIPPDQMERVLSQDRCDIDPGCLGFVGIYSALAVIVPDHWTVVDLGCAYAPQAHFFKDHAAYIGVDLYEKERFACANTTHFVMPIEKFIEQHLGDFDLDTTFAICSYVPPWGGDNLKLARTSFKNVFTYYPAGERLPFRPSA